MINFGKHKKFLLGLGFGALIAVSVGVRLPHFKTMHPYFYYYDEWRQANQSLKLIRNKTLNPDWFLYPHFSLYPTALAYAAYFFATNFREIIAQKSLAPAFEAAQKMDELSWQALLIERICFFCFSMLSVIGFFFLARSLLGDGFGLAASFIYSLFPLAVTFSHIAKVDTFVVCFGILALLFEVRLLRQGRARDYVLSAFFAALTFDSKVNYDAVLSFFVAMFLRAANENARPLKAMLDRRVIYAVSALAATMILANPFYFAHLNRAFQDASWLIYSVSWIPYYHFYPQHWWLDKYYYALTVIIPAMAGVPVWVLALAGIAYKIVKIDFKEWFLMLFNFFSFGYTFTNFMHFPYLTFYFLPLIALFCGLTIQLIYRHRGRAGKIAGLAVLALILLISFHRRDFYQLTNFQAFDTAGKWMAKELKPGSKLISFSVHPPGPGLNRLEAKQVWPQDLSRKMIVRENPEYILVSAWDFAGFNKYYRNKIPIAKYYHELLDGQWGYKVIHHFPVSYPGDWWYQLLDSEFIVDLILLEKVH